MNDASTSSRPPSSRWASLAAEWLATHGQGRLRDEHREELRQLLVRELSLRFGGSAAVFINDEVGRFLDSGRVSDMNLCRLERKVQSRLAAGGLSANTAERRPSTGASVAASVAGSGKEVPTSGALTARRLPAVQEDTGEPVSTWSQVAQFSKYLEEQDRVRRDEAVRSSQQMMRSYLDQQVETKKQQKLRAAEAEKRLFEQQEAELERWKATQASAAEKAKSCELEIKRDRELQVTLLVQRREEEEKQKLSEDRLLVKQAARDLEEELKKQAEKKCQSKQRQHLLAQEWAKGKELQEQKKQQLREEERKRMQEYTEMLERQEARSKQNLVKARQPRGVDAVLPKQGRRGEDAYNEENMLRKLEEANRRRDEEERRKQERLKTERLNNQDFLFQQMAEREKLRRQAKDMDGSQKQATQAASVDFQDAERKRLEDMRIRNLQYRVELERQIQAKRAAAALELTEDMMSSAEKAINRKLLQEVSHLREQVRSISPSPRVAS